MKKIQAEALPKRFRNVSVRNFTKVSTVLRRSSFVLRSSTGKYLEPSFFDSFYVPVVVHIVFRVFLFSFRLLFIPLLSCWNFPPRPFQEFTPLPMTYEDLLPSLIANHLAVVTPGKVLQPPFPKWYDPNATCKYHGGVPGHSIEKCLALKYKVQHLIDAGWLTFCRNLPFGGRATRDSRDAGSTKGIRAESPPTFI